MRPLKAVKPSSPSGVTRACNAGPNTNPNTCANEIIETAFVRSFSLVAALKYDRQRALLALK